MPRSRFNSRRTAEDRRMHEVQLFLFVCSITLLTPSLLGLSFSGRIVELATNCYGCHVLQKALDCEEDIRLLIVSELLAGDPAQTLVNKHASHVWSKVRISCQPSFSWSVLTTAIDYGIDMD